MRHNQDHQTLNGSKCSPSLLSVLDSIENGEVQRIEKNLTGLLEAHAVLPPIGEVLCLVPLKPNASHVKIIITIL